MTIDILVQKAERLSKRIKLDIDNLWDPNEVTKKEVRELLDQMPNLDEGDIADKLNLDLELACQICDELLTEGKIKRIPY